MSERFPGGIISKTAPVPTGPYENGTAPGIWTLEQQAEFVKQGIWPIAGNVPNYIEDVFQTWLYTGNGSTQTINNGIDLAGKGGLVWLKRRDAVSNHNLFDTARGATKKLYSDLTNAEFTDVTSLTSFNSNGFSLGLDGGGNANGGTYASWTFREQPKFFDVVTYTGDGTSNRSINHSLGAVPGCVIVKKTNAAQNWAVWHRTFTTGDHMYLNTTGAVVNNTVVFGSNANTSTTFNVGSFLNANGDTYVAYLFAHNAGGFGLTETDNVISCGSYTGNGVSSGPTVTLGYEPQWLLTKRASGSTSNWFITDNMRGMPVQGDEYQLYPNLSSAESFDQPPPYTPTATGFNVTSAASSYNESGATYIYVAIRRGPMKTPTSGTSVYTSAYGTGSSNPAWISGFPVDFSVDANIGGGSTDEKNTGSRLLQGRYGVTNTTAAWAADASKQYAFQNGFQTTNNGSTDFAWMFRRAPSFMDVVCYSGTGVARTVAHNLTVVPELMIVKRRDTVANWAVYTGSFGGALWLRLNTTDGNTFGSTIWNDTNPTSSVFTVGTSSVVNASGGTYVAYLFASCPGVSKVGSFTGTGATQVINCGFTGGARFVLIKATSTTGNWMVWDSTRGIVAGNDPFVVWNDNLGETTGTDWVDTAATGFELSNAGGNLANSNGVSYVFLAVA